MITLLIVLAGIGGLCLIFIVAVYLFSYRIRHFAVSDVAQLVDQGNLRKAVDRAATHLMPPSSAAVLTNRAIAESMIQETVQLIGVFLAHKKSDGTVQALNSQALLVKKQLELLSPQPSEGELTEYERSRIELDRKVLEFRREAAKW